MESRILVGNVSYARFGYAMANLGDINGDSFHGEGTSRLFATAFVFSIMVTRVFLTLFLHTDVAISAPFGAGESGTVFIYRGSVQNTLNTNPVQVSHSYLLVGSAL